MPRYRVRDGQVLPVNGQILEAGGFVDLPRTVADDMANRHLVEEVDAAGQPVTPTPVDDLERFKAHERVGFLRDRLAAAKAIVGALEARLANEEQALVQAVQAVAPATGKATKQTAAPAAAKE